VHSGVGAPSGIPGGPAPDTGSPAGPRVVRAVRPLLHTTLDLGPGAPARLPPVAPRAYASTVHVGSDDRPAATRADGVRLPLPGGGTATAWVAELHRVTGALATLTAPERATA
jgi:urease accessory protein